MKIDDIDGIDQYESPTGSWSAKLDLLPDAAYISTENLMYYTLFSVNVNTRTTILKLTKVCKPTKLSCQSG